MKNNSVSNNPYQQEQENLKVLIEQLSTELELRPLKENELANNILKQLNQLANQAESSCRFTTIEDLRELLIKLSDISGLKEISDEIVLKS